MAVNPYFSNGSVGVGAKSEQELTQQMTDELIQLAGHDMYYVPRVNVKVDELLGEDVLTAFTGYYIIEMYFNNVNDWGGSDDLLSKFGLVVDHTAELIVSRKRFKEETDFKEPREGDLIYFPLTKSLLKIDHVEYENPFYMQSKLYTFMLKCSLYTYSHEQFTTGIKPIDTDLDNQAFLEQFGDNEIINDEAGQIIDFSEDFKLGDPI